MNVAGMERMVRGKTFYRKGIAGYFTVEAALIIPVVFACYFAIIVFMICIYERCILEQNAYRLPVWREYVEGYINLYPEENDEITETEICQYILGCLEAEESSRYLLGQNIQASVRIRGEYVEVTRSISYDQAGGWTNETTCAGICLMPVEYIRTINLLKNKITGDEGEVNDKE